MDIKELANRPDNFPLTQDEALFLIDEYIFEKKSKRVRPRIETRGGVVMMHNEIQLMFKALIVASSYFRNKLN